MQSLADQLARAFPKKDKLPSNSKPRCVGCNRYVPNCKCRKEQVGSVKDGAQQN